MHRALVAAASSRGVGWISKTWLWRVTVWKLGRLLLRLGGARLTAAPGLPTALLETRGARTGCARRTSVIYFHDGDAPTIIASQAGYPGHPGWYYNVRANPVVRLGGQAFAAQLVEDEAELERLWELATRVFPGFARYRIEAARHGRRIPVLRLRPHHP